LADLPRLSIVMGVIGYKNLNFHVGLPQMSP
jgi:hypothetical protein